MDDRGHIKRFSSDDEAARAGYIYKLTRDETERLMAMPRRERVASHIQKWYVCAVKGTRRVDMYPGQSTAHLVGAWRGR